MTTVPKRQLCFLLLSTLLSLLLVSCLSRAAGADGLTLVENGTPRSELVLGSNATKAAQLAAFELQEHVKLITGATLPIVGRPSGKSVLPIYVGDSKAAQAIAGVTAFEKEEYELRFLPRAIILRGQDKNDTGKVNYYHATYKAQYDYMTWPDLYDAKGSLYAAYDLLEKYCDVRWFNHSEFGTDVIRRNTLTITGHSYRRHPAFLYRAPGALTRSNMDLYDRRLSRWTIGWSKPTPRYEKWVEMLYPQGKALPENTHPHRWAGYRRGRVYAFFLRHKLGGEAFKVNHSFHDWYDRFWQKNPRCPERFEGHHPDYFAQGYPKAKQPPQLCYTNPKVVKQVIRDIDAFYALPPAQRASQRLGGEDYYPIVPMDNSNYCKCERCRTFGSPTRITPHFSNGDHSRMIWSFVNQVARGIREKHPHINIAALSYATYAFRPEGMKIEDNITVQPCLFPHFYATGNPGLQTDEKMLRQWADGRPLYLWLYTAWTTGHKPGVPWFPRFIGQAWSPLLNKYRSAGVRGMFFDGIGNSSDMYCLYKCSDNPDRDSNELITDYFTRMFGPGAGNHLLKFYQLIENTYRTKKNYSTGVTGPALYWGIQGNGSLMKSLTNLINSAEAALAAGDNDLYRKRFAIFKYDIWDYMLEGRKEYVKAMTGKEASAKSSRCPAQWPEGAEGDLSRVDWSDSQSLTGWNLDNGDQTLRKIRSSFIADEKFLYLQIMERELLKAPQSADRWEIQLLNRVKDAKAACTLSIDSDGQITGRTKADGAPQDWTLPGAVATSAYHDHTWIVQLALPRKELPVNQKGILQFNARRVSHNGVDEPVWLPTNNNYASASAGIQLAFATRSSAIPGQALSQEALFLSYDFSGRDDRLIDKSGKRHDGQLAGKIKRCKATEAPGSPDAVNFSGGTSHLKVPAPPKGPFTLTFWFKYPDIKRRAGMQLLNISPLTADLVLPHRKILFLARDDKNRKYGIGPTGAELTTDLWHQWVLRYNDSVLEFFTDGRLRATLNLSRSPEFLSAKEWTFGGETVPVWMGYQGQISQLAVYTRALSAEEIFLHYQQDRKRFGR